MIIRQRTTFFDSFLLKVVFPYLASRNHRSLLRVAHYWNNDVSTQRQAALPAVVEPLRDYEGSWQHSLHAVSRWLQPQVLVPVPATNRRSNRRARAFHDKE